MEMEKSDIYHERQRLQLCLLHCLNNLFQGVRPHGIPALLVMGNGTIIPIFEGFILLRGLCVFDWETLDIREEKDAFTRMDLNSIAERLDHDDPSKRKWTPVSFIFKPHHNVVTGNYDVNVLIAAVENKGKQVVWHDRRTGASTIDFDGTESQLMGIVLNVHVKRYGGLLRGRHWVALRRISGIWYDLDSDFAAPYEFKDTAEVREFLDGIIAAGAEVLLIMHGDSSKL